MNTEAAFVAARLEAHRAAERDDLEATQSIVDPFAASGVWRIDGAGPRSAPELSQRYTLRGVRLGVRQAI
jgi:hypothetical protein